MIRQMAVAGSFYPQGEKELKSLVTQYLQAVPKGQNRNLKIIVVPHAGYIYSGRIAAVAFKQLQEQKIKNVILLGCSHQAYFSGAALWGKEPWQTPLGKLLVAEKLNQKIQKNELEIRNYEIAHFQEHSLEVQLPFLQTVLKNDFQILPILLGEVNIKTQKYLVQKIKEILDDETILVISSDLSHYPSYEIANQVDQKTVKAILTNEVSQFQKVIMNQMEKDYPNLVICACGQKAIEIGMMVAKELELTPELLQYQNSGDISGEKDQVVGYAAIGWKNKV